MTGADVQAIRALLGADPTRFSQLLGVHPTTLYRWEARLGDVAKIEPFQLQILTVLKQQLEARRTSEERARFAEAVLTGLLVGGGLFALFKLLQVAFDGAPEQRRTGGAAARPIVGRSKSPPKRTRTT